MLRPERMSRVSVTGSKQVMDDVIEAVHDMHLFHVTDYDGDWDGFRRGEPAAGADDVSELLVTVRSLESILDVSEAQAGPRRVLDSDEIEAELATVREEVNALDDRRDDLLDRRRAIDEELEAVRPFAELGIDLDLLQGYDSLSVAVGEADHAAVERALTATGTSFAVYGDEDTDLVAAFARTADLDGDLEDALVGTDFTTVEVPDAEGDPAAYRADLEAEREDIAAEIEAVDDELAALRHEYGAFLLAAEESLTVAVQRQEAPLSFATTDNAFVAEGWIPTERFVDLAEGLYEAVGDHVDVDELERAEYDGEGLVIDREEVGPGIGPGTPTAADGGETVRSDGGTAAGVDPDADPDSDPDAETATDDRARADGGTMTMGESDPPVVQDNPGPVQPFEALVQVINRPKYSELDPTVLLFLTFPLFFGFMIGDLGYGLLYLGIGYWITRAFDSDVIRSLGAIGMWAGGFTAVFGVLYGEFFGLHALGDLVWAGHPPIHKGLQPGFAEYAGLWLVVAVIVGMVHVSLGWINGFVNDLSHGVREAVLENASWILMMFGLWGWVFSTHLASIKPGFLVGPEAALNGNPIALGFGGLPPTVGFLGLAAFVIGVVMIASVDPIEAVEAIFLQVLVNALSYTRIAAVLLAKAGMAFVVNLLVFGAYEHDGEFHFIFIEGKSPAGVVEEFGAEALIFPGMVNGEGLVALVLGIIGGFLVLVIGHVLVLALGVTSAGLQAVRLEYVEFFQKFYEGGGEPYQPFGYDRRYTAEE